MALPSPTKVSGKHNVIFEAYYKQVDPKGIGTIQAMDAAKFLKKSALSDVVLSRIWDLSDPNAKGYLDKPGFFVALKLVSLAQCGQVIKMSNIFFETENPPRVGEIPKIIPQKISTVPHSSNDWSMKPGEREKYENLFQSLKPVNGLLHGNSVKKVLLDSKLPMETLGRIWDLADQDRDGSLDKHEFTVAMHLVYQALEKRTVPEVLPLELQKPKLGAPPPIPPAPVHAAMPKAPSGNFNDGGFVANFPKDIGPPPVPPLPAAIPPPIPPMSSVPSMVPSNLQPSVGNLISTEPIIPTATAPTTQQSVDWVITQSDLLRYETMFRESDRDKDGLVSGLEVKGVFLQSGVQQNCLAHIWALCDTHQTGKLTLEQFALAMWMVERKKMNIEPPEALTPNMVPPSLRATVKGVDVVAAESKPTYTNPELEMLSKEIEELSRERRVLEADIAQKEADIRIKSGEIRSLQSELDTLMATLKQLENQKGEAQKRLDDLKTQVNKIREQCQKQEETINEQEGELNTKRSELQKLKDEETALEKEYESSRQEVDKLSNQLSYTQLGISQVRASLTQLLELERQMTDALLLCKAAIESQDTHIVSEYSLKIDPDLSEARLLLDKTFEPPNQTEIKPDPFSAPTNKTSTSVASTKITDAFGNQDAFSSSMTNNNNGWAESDTFQAKFDDGFGNDTFVAKPSSNLTSDPFGDARQTSTSPVPPGKDDFGSDPFAALHAPTGQGKVLSPNAQKSGPPPRPESPSPALPPKKSKQPPPRPAPPRPLQGPTRPAPPVQDAFGSTGGGGFADFDDFDNKQPSLPPPPLPIFTNNNNINNIKTDSESFTFTTTANAFTNNNHNNNNNDIMNNISNSITSINFTNQNENPSSPILDTITTKISNTILSNNTNPYTTTINDTFQDNKNIVSNVLNNYQRPEIQPKLEDDKLKFDDSFNANFMDVINETNEKTQKQTDSNLNANLFNNSFNNNNINKIDIGAKNNINNSKINSDLETIAKVIPVTSNVPAATEFADDPFKDYRYEDIFNIKDDPFAEEDDDDANDTESSEDPFSSDTKQNSTIIDNSSNSISKTCEQLENFTLTPISSPVTKPDFMQKHASSIQQPVLPMTSASRPLSNSEFGADFANFDAFNDNFTSNNETNKNNNDIINNNNDHIFGTKSAFDDTNDVFNTNTLSNKQASSKYKMETIEKSTTNKTENIANNNFNADFSKVKNDNFFESFNDNFITPSSSSSSSLTTRTDTITIANATSNFKINKSTSDPFDAFGGTKTTKSSKIFDSNFEDNFFKTATDHTANLTTSTQKIKTNIASAFATTIPFNNNNSALTTNTSENNNNLDPFGDSAFNDAFANFENVKKSSKDDIKKINFGKNDLNTWSFDNNKKDKKTMLNDSSKSMGRINMKKNSDKKNNYQQSSKTVSTVSSSVSDKVTDKFAEDYSKADNFDADFEEALRRSMIDQ